MNKGNDSYTEVLHIYGLVIRELLKSEKVSVNMVGDELWFTDKKYGKTLKMKTINKRNDKQ